MDEEFKLVRRAKEGDEAAFEELVRLYEKKIYAMGLRYTGNPQDALDIAQEVFLRVFRFIRRFQEESGFSTWLYRIAANVCKDAVVKSGKFKTTPLEVENEKGNFETEIADLRFSPENETENAELRRLLISGIEALPEKYREVIILRDINGLSYESIAASLSLEDGTVKSRISRGRESLRKYLYKHGNFGSRGQSE